MKTIITQNHDGHDVVIGFGNADAFIDPVATGKIVNKKLAESSDTFKQITVIKEEMIGYAQEGIQAMKVAKAEAKAMQATTNASTKATHKKKVDEHYAIWTAKNDQIKECQEKLKPLATAFLQERGQAMKDNAIYFTLPQGETIVTDDEAAKASDAKAKAEAEGKLITKDLKVIENSKGVISWKKSDGMWVKMEVLKVGDKIQKGSIVESDLSEEQKAEIVAQLETDRISKMSKVDKAKELEQVTASIRKQALDMRSALEIDGDSAALSKAQDWLATELGKAEERYK